MPKLQTAKEILKNLPRVPGALFSIWRGPMETIHLTNDDGKKLEIAIQRLRKSDKIIIRGLGFIPLRMKVQKAISWSSDFMERAAELRGLPDEKSLVDQHTHMMKIPGARKKLSVRNTIRLGFAINQIINSGPTYFNQESTGGTFNIIDTCDYAVPDVRISPAEPEKEEAEKATT